MSGLIGSINTSYFYGDYDPIMTNLYGVTYSIQAELAYWDAHGINGVIVNTASYLGIFGVADLSLYDASKHAIIGLTETVALEVHTSFVLFSVHASLSVSLCLSLSVHQ